MYCLMKLETYCLRTVELIWEVDRAEMQGAFLVEGENVNGFGYLDFPFLIKGCSLGRLLKEGILD